MAGVKLCHFSDSQELCSPGSAVHPDGEGVLGGNGAGAVDGCDTEVPRAGMWVEPEAVGEGRIHRSEVGPAIMEGAGFDPHAIFGLNFDVFKKLTASARGQLRNGLRGLWELRRRGVGWTGMRGDSLSSLDLVGEKAQMWSPETFFLRW